MPATSKAQQAAMAIAEHEPDKLFSRNRKMLNMTGEQLHDFASTKTSSLPVKKRKPKVSHKAYGGTPFATPKAVDTDEDGY